MDSGSMLYEVDNIDKELKRMRKKMKDLNTRKKELVNQIIEYMRENDKKEETYNGRKFILKEKPKSSRKAKQETKADIIAILNEEGFHGNEAEEMYNKIVSANKGPEEIVYELKM